MQSEIEVRVPQLSESVAEATLVTWHKQVGESVAEGENLIDIETDKVVLELPAIKSGVLTKILKQNGDKVGSGEVIAILDTAARPAAATAAAVPPTSAPVNAGQSETQAQPPRAPAPVMPAARAVTAAAKAVAAVAAVATLRKMSSRSSITRLRPQHRRYRQLRKVVAADAWNSGCR